MAVDFFINISVNVVQGYGNILLNGFESSLSVDDKARKVGIQLKHFSLCTDWSIESCEIVDLSTQDRYCKDSENTVRFKCLLILLGTPIVQTIGLTLNLLNRVAKIVSLAHLWHPSDQKYDFTARLLELGKDISVVVATPFIMIGMLFAALYGIIVPYDGRKLYGTCERFAYSGGYGYFEFDGHKGMQNCLLAPCFQPDPQYHLGGGEMGTEDAW